MASANKTTETEKSEKKKSNGGMSRSAPIKKALGDLDTSTELYTGADVDVLLETSKLIEDEDIPGDFYSLTIKSGRLILRKVASAES